MMRSHNNGDGSLRFMAVAPPVPLMSIAEGLVEKPSPFYFSQGASGKLELALADVLPFTSGKFELAVTSGGETLTVELQQSLAWHVATGANDRAGRPRHVAIQEPEPWRPNEILTSDGALLWRGDEPPLRAAVRLARQRPWLDFCGTSMVVGSTGHEVVVQRDLADWIGAAAAIGRAAGKPCIYYSYPVSGATLRVGHGKHRRFIRHMCYYCMRSCEPHKDGFRCGLDCQCIAKLWR